MELKSKEEYHVITCHLVLIQEGLNVMSALTEMGIPGGECQGQHVHECLECAADLPNSFWIFSQAARRHRIAALKCPVSKQCLYSLHY
ncbi:hypothetical protein CDAR_544021 [Caerostris darwini]|uniref:Uncharacterized protein n=1 Tax=Caerostris darwini TaxID=1538125 RepID=A0AAV4TL24_9ARAC|nr:hypothetical protein CDAR_544021 [Caerostris darwini]